LVNYLSVSCKKNNCQIFNYHWRIELKQPSNLKIAALGGCGGMGAIAVQTLIKQNFFGEIIVVDIDFDRVNQFVQNCKDQRLKAR
jgi:tRNA A37 threonylcarbamoyladenosine dehydratase